MKSNNNVKENYTDLATVLNDLSFSYTVDTHAEQALDDLDRSIQELNELVKMMEFATE